MEIKQANTTTTTLTNNTTFKVKESPLMFEILSSRLYSNPIKAIVRELLTNAYDSHKVRGNTSDKIMVTLPSVYSNNFVIRDYGVGLSEQAMVTLYTTFFDSTKNQDNELTGGFGLGSKTPFAYADTFFVNSYYNGVLYKYVLFKNNGTLSINKVKEVTTDEDNGLEVIIPVHKTDESRFVDELSSFISYNPEVLIATDYNRLVINKPICSHGPYVWYENHNKSIIKQGQNVFFIEDIIRNFTEKDKEAFSEISYTILENMLEDDSVMIEVPIGTFEVSPDRETLHLNKETIVRLQHTLLDYYKYLEVNKDELTKLGVKGTIHFKLCNYKNDLIHFSRFDRSYWGKELTAYIFHIPTRGTSILDVKVSNNTSSRVLHHSSYSMRFPVAPDKQNRIFLICKEEDNTAYKLSKAKKCLNQIVEDTVLIYLVIKEGEDLDKVKAEVNAFIDVISSLQCTLGTIESYFYDEFCSKFNVKVSSAKSLSKTYRVFTGFFKNYNLTNYGNAHMHYNYGNNLYSILDIDNCRKNYKFKYLISSETEKAATIKHIGDITGLSKTSNTLYDYISETYDVDLSGYNKGYDRIEIILCHKEAFKLSELPVFDLAGYEKYISKIKEIPNFLYGEQELISLIPSILTIIDYIYKNSRHLDKLYNSQEYKTLKALIKYAEQESYRFVYENSNDKKATKSYLVTMALQAFSLRTLNSNYVLDLASSLANNHSTDISWRNQNILQRVGSRCKTIINKELKICYT